MLGRVASRLPKLSFGCASNDLRGMMHDSLSRRMQALMLIQSEHLCRPAKPPEKIARCRFSSSPRASAKALLRIPAAALASDPFLRDISIRSKAKKAKKAKKGKASKARGYDTGFESGDEDESVADAYWQTVAFGENPSWLTGHWDPDESIYPSPEDEEYSESDIDDEVEEEARPEVHCFWDLDNKKIESKAEVKTTVEYIRGVLNQFGRVTAVHAFGNQKCFSFVPEKERLDRKAFNAKKKDILDDKVRCDVCGAGFKSYDKLEKHFKIHSKEVRKRRNHANSKKGKRKKALEARYFTESRKSKYNDTLEKFAVPKKGFRLKQELSSADVMVVKTDNLKEAADQAMRGRIDKTLSLMKSNPKNEYYICVVSDDRGFTKDLERCNIANVKGRIAICSGSACYGPNAEHYFNWESVKCGLHSSPPSHGQPIAALGPKVSGPQVTKKYAHSSRIESPKQVA